MRRRIFNTRTIVLVFALLTGLVCNGFFPFMYLTIGTATAMGLTIIGFAVDLILKSSKGVRITGLVFIFFLFATIASFVSMKISEYATTRLSNKVIQALYDYRYQAGHFPEEINHLALDGKTKTAFNTDQHYWTDSTMQQFEIRGWSDGWNFKTFHSRDSTWVLDD